MGSLITIFKEYCLLNLLNKLNFYFLNHFIESGHRFLDENNIQILYIHKKQ